MGGPQTDVVHEMSEYYTGVLVTTVSISSRASSFNPFIPNTATSIDGSAIEAGGIMERPSYKYIYPW